MKPKIDKKLVGETFDHVSMCYTRAFEKWGERGWRNLSDDQKKAEVALQFLYMSAGQMIDSELTRIAKGIVKVLNKD